MRGGRPGAVVLSPIKAIELEASRLPDTISLAQGIPDFDTPEPIKRFVVERLAAGSCARYSVTPGLPALREAIADALLTLGVSEGTAENFERSEALQREALRMFEASGDERHVLSVARIDVPVYGFYGSKDTRVMNSLDATKAAMAAAGTTYEPIVYEGADHASHPPLPASRSSFTPASPSGWCVAAITRPPSPRCARMISRNTSCAGPSRTRSVATSRCCSATTSAFSAAASWSCPNWRRCR